MLRVTGWGIVVCAPVPQDRAARSGAGALKRPVSVSSLVWTCLPVRIGDAHDLEGSARALGRRTPCTVTSDDVADDRPLAKAVGRGEGWRRRSPAVLVERFPPETKSLPSHPRPMRPRLGLWRWAVYDIRERHLAFHGAGARERRSTSSGRGDAVGSELARSYRGRAPSRTGTHHYNIIVHALDVESADLDQPPPQRSSGSTRISRPRSRGGSSPRSRRPVTSEDPFYGLPPAGQCFTPVDARTPPSPIISTPPVAPSRSTRRGDRPNHCRAVPAASAHALSLQTASTRKSTPSSNS